MTIHLMCGHSCDSSQVGMPSPHLSRSRAKTLDARRFACNQLQTKTSSANPSTIPQPSSSYRSPCTFSSWPQTQSTMRLLNGTPLKSVLTHTRRHLTRQPAPAMAFSAHLAVKTTMSQMISRFVHANPTSNLSASHNTVP